MVFSGFSDYKADNDVLDENAMMRMLLFLAKSHQKHGVSASDFLILLSRELLILSPFCNVSNSD